MNLALKIIPPFPPNTSEKLTKLKNLTYFAVIPLFIFEITRYQT